jgi:alkaline phosphatase D
MNALAAIRRVGSERTAADLDRTPFSCAVSAHPTRDGAVLHTHFAQFPYRTDAGMDGSSITGQVKVFDINDINLTTPLATHNVTAAADNGYTARKLVAGLPEGGEYWYRFFCGDYASDVGRFKCLPPAGVTPASLKLAHVSCQDWQSGYFEPVYNSIVAQQPDLLALVGDLGYLDATPGGNEIRTLPAAFQDGPCRTLPQARRFWRLYKSAPGLRQGLAATGITWAESDHERAVNNWWAGGAFNGSMSGTEWAQHQALMAQALFEAWPWMPDAYVTGSRYIDQRSRLRYGGLVDILRLNDRESRSTPPCGSSAVFGYCSSENGVNRRMIEASEETWILNAAAANSDHFVLLTASPFGPMDFRAWMGDEAKAHYYDGWQANTVQRKRIVDGIVAEDAGRNLMVLTGDLHLRYLQDVPSNPNNLASAPIAHEAHAPSVTSSGSSTALQQHIEVSSQNPQLADLGPHGGYLLHEITANLWTTKAYEADVTNATNTAALVGTHYVQSGSPGWQV